MRLSAARSSGAVKTLLYSSETTTRWPGFTFCFRYWTMRTSGPSLAAAGGAASVARIGRHRSMSPTLHPRPDSATPHPLTAPAVKPATK